MFLEQGAFLLTKHLLNLLEELKFAGSSLIEAKGELLSPELLSPAT
jgi:hypothetical protein